MFAKSSFQLLLRPRLMRVFDVVAATSLPKNLVNSGLRAKLSEPLVRAA